MPEHNLNRGQEVQVPGNITQVIVQFTAYHNNRAQYTLTTNGGNPTGGGAILNDGDNHVVQLNGFNGVRNVTPNGIGGQNPIIQVRW
ncbi:hypothetical protein [Snuella sedimenti]|uniref:Uncharacterized protein n=1 Tax=Snuella sedimenti TaxID=2798802 RepID=A0A8J7J2J3_9FLAO|nr:hypothetical protein [Snuella sedimenti]MBJ6367028.1 hypothetical protein [Snuella sedimenti]